MSNQNESSQESSFYNLNELFNAYGLLFKKFMLYKFEEGLIQKAMGDFIDNSNYLTITALAKRELTTVVIERNNLSHPIINLKASELHFFLSIMSKVDTLLKESKANGKGGLEHFKELDSSLAEFNGWFNKTFNPAAISNKTYSYTLKQISNFRKLSNQKQNDNSETEKILTTNPIQEELKTKKQELKDSLSKYGFYNLDKIKALNKDGQNDLIDLLIENKLPYCIAMLNYLRFLPYLEENHASTKKGAQIIISNCLKSDSDGRAVRGNYDSLVKPNDRYTAYLHKQTVINNYQELIKGVPLV